MPKGKFGGPRPLVDDDGKGPLGFDRPLAGDKEERLIAELESAIADEDGAEQEYMRIIIMLRETGFDNAADTVEEIRSQEMEHRGMLENVLGEIRRSKS